MARLHEYNSNSTRNGYYLKGWTKHSGNSTLQVRYPCELLFDWLGFEPGDKIPSDLLLPLIDSDLLYTIGDGAESNQDVDWTPSLDAVSEELSDRQRQRLLGFVRDYDGPRNGFISDLCSDLDTGERIPNSTRLSSNTNADRNWQACLDSDSRGADQSLHEIAQEVYQSEPLSDEVATILREWDTEDSLEHFSDFPHIESSVVLFRDYPGKVHSVTARSNSVTYVVSLPSSVSESLWPKPEEIDEDKRWPRFIVSHINLEEEDVPMFVIQIPVPVDDSMDVEYDIDTLLHNLTIIDGTLGQWLVKSDESSLDELTQGRGGFSGHLDDVFSQTVLLMDCLTGETVAEDTSEVLIEFGESSVFDF